MGRFFERKKHVFLDNGFSVCSIRIVCFFLFMGGYEA